MRSEVYQSFSKMIEKWRQNGAQSGPRDSTGSKNHAQITKTRPEAIPSGTLVAFWMKNGSLSQIAQPIFLIYRNTGSKKENIKTIHLDFGLEINFLVDTQII